jgi:uncharacterized protein
MLRNLELSRLPKFNIRDYQPQLTTRLLILQPTAFCNISCDYCYLPDRDKFNRMSLETVRLSAERLLEDRLAGENLTVVWHAGEPLTVPIAFYEDAIGIIKQTLGPATEVTHAIQTNGVLINDDWCHFFKRNNVSVGISIDGPAHIHDVHRRTRLGQPTHRLVVRGIEVVKSHGIPFQAIAVITSTTLAEPDAFFDFFLNHNIQDVGCSFDETEGCHAASSLNGKEEYYRQFFERVLKRSYSSDKQVRIRELDYAYSLIAKDLPRYRWNNETWPDNAQVMPLAFITVGWNGEFSTFSPEFLGQSSRSFGNFAVGNVARSSFVGSTHNPVFIKMWADVIYGLKACSGLHQAPAAFRILAIASFVQEWPV